MNAEDLETIDLKKAADDEEEGEQTATAGEEKTVWGELGTMGVGQSKGG